jgi:hypothetical protein
MTARPLGAAKQEILANLPVVCELNGVHTSFLSLFQVLSRILPQLWG